MRISYAVFFLCLHVQHHSFLTRRAADLPVRFRLGTGNSAVLRQRRRNHDVLQSENGKMEIAGAKRAAVSGRRFLTAVAFQAKPSMPLWTDRRGNNGPPRID